MGNRKRTKAKPETILEQQTGSYPLKPDPTKQPLRTKVVWDLHVVPDSQLIDEIKRRGLQYIFEPEI
jgi:hypothetical protein